VAYWVMKSEPGSWSWEDQRAAPGGRAEWDGVRNAEANNHMKSMGLGDLAFFYHSGGERRVVGIVEVVREWYPDRHDETGRFGMVDVRAVEVLPQPVTLADVKADPCLAHLPLVRRPRLSVSPVDGDAWRRIARKGGLRR